jgi:SUN domain-containing protein 1/2
VRCQHNQILSLFKECWLPIPPREVMLMPNMNPTECWPMNGTRGYVTVRLRRPIVPNFASLEHISWRMSPDVTSAPRLVKIFVRRRCP